MFERCKRIAEIRAERRAVAETLAQLSPEDPKYTEASMNYERLVNLEKDQGLEISAESLLRVTKDLAVMGVLVFHEDLGNLIQSKWMKFFDK